MQLSNREMASLFWLVIAFAFFLGSTSTRSAILGLFKLVFSKFILQFFFLYTAINVFLLYGLHIKGIWTHENLKSTVMWIFASFPAFLTNAFQTMDGPELIGRIFKQISVIAIALNVYLNLYNFPIIIEILLQPLMLILVLMQVIPNSELKSLQGMGQKLQNLIGLGVFIYAAVKIITRFHQIAWASIFKDSLIPTILWIGSLPLLFVLRMLGDKQQRDLHRNWKVKN